MSLRIKGVQNGQRCWRDCFVIFLQLNPFQLIKSLKTDSQNITSWATYEFLRMVQQYLSKINLNDWIMIFRYIASSPEHHQLSNLRFPSILILSWINTSKFYYTSYWFHNKICTNLLNLIKLSSYNYMYEQ